MPIVNFRTGRTLTARQVRQEIMRMRGWTSKEYERNYDRLRNRARNYEQITGARVENVAELLYNATVAEQRGYKSGYAPLRQYRAVMATTSASTGAFARQVAAGRVSERQSTTQRELLLNEYAGLISQNFDNIQARIAGVTDPAELRRILEENANALRTWREMFAREHGLRPRDVGSP